MRLYFVVMMMAAAAAVGLASVEGSLVHDRNVGGFRQVDPDDDNKGDFFTATSDKAHYSSSNDPFVCVTSFDKVLQQVVSGINYQFHVHGCAVDAPSKAKADCTCGDRPIQKFVIEVYAQAWTQTYKVTKVSTVPQRHEL
ncbi:hypothetical protein, variant 2 [Aphanomyces astaci]|uniref:Cystatin domain-containing protein n=1 Tax=Aphanomyces astaci TaxID=112090 RepID=W4FEF3_APHAT|nr:hypothetical protein H257_17983 [Aphanomyces astaci]XP_009845271.1 hypothetical protein, variant 1 [Aphanomyces astaci]XP_009845272.1 hypothetical protein, variant 2 [Aphanomyces astaci]ETV65269.1 hypothetical protein H257_17983 [Aphanomyces astaci]ETV65270.1 hypothetical protein, variant 1 [Aphanomyces astaci]ETV65271.1 hypothetical protein, variant 2 [Aphanomyces astaci]RQM28274.1 hypothetical protein B5M09_007820 [Aphanomyces astaci]|eukprot:XP_009845270.1 hypothetical protein H257_17983 [Aphanomyces astaci]